MVTRKTGRALALIALLLTVACGDSGPKKFTANLGCTSFKVIEMLQPGIGVNFVTDSGDAKTLERWRNTVGSPVVDRADRSCETAPLDSILVVSWNVNVANGDIRRFVSDLRGGRVLPGVEVRHFVLLLQEAYREDKSLPDVNNASLCPDHIPGQNFDIETMADSLALALFYVPSMRNGCDVKEDRGNAILATLPLSNLAAIELPVVRQRRVAAMAEVKGHASDGTAWTLDVVSTHFENRGAGRPKDWQFGRARQARALVKALPTGPLMVVGGDFNTIQGPTEPAVKIVGAHFMNTAAHQDQITYVKYNVVRSHLDYLFFNGTQKTTKYWRANSRYGSDHYPIMGFVKVG